MKEIITDPRIPEQDRYLVNTLIIVSLKDLPENESDSFGLATTFHDGNRAVVLGPTAQLVDGIASGKFEPGLEGIPEIHQIAARLAVAWMNNSEEAFDLAVEHLRIKAAAASTSADCHESSEADVGNPNCLGCVIVSFLEVFEFICSSVKETVKCM